MTPVDAPRLASRQHAVVRRFRLAARGGDACVLLDGEHLVSEALASSVPIDTLISNGQWPDLECRAEASGARVHRASDNVIAAASPVRTPTGIVALARWKAASPADALAGTNACALGLAGVQDPGNLGSAIRAADALGASGVLTLDDSADPRGWKALRGAMGSTFHLPVARTATSQAIADARARSIRVVAAVASGGTPIDRVGLASPVLLLVGSEGAGLPDSVLNSVDERATIPMRSGVESLNVAVTAALLLFEARRQRISRGTPA